LLTIASSDESTMAASRARTSSARLRSLRSRAIFEAPMMVPAVVRTGDTVTTIGMRSPPLATRTVSKWSITSPARRRAMTFSSSAKRSGGTISVIGWPIASAAL
jgi:hypothetical protein